MTAGGGGGAGGGVSSQWAADPARSCGRCKAELGRIINRGAVCRYRGATGESYERTQGTGVMWYNLELQTIHWFS